LTELEGAKHTCQSGPDARTARAQRLAGAAGVAAADVAPNPALVVEHERRLSGGTEHETVLGVSVPLSIGGRRSLLQDAARVRREQADSTATETLFESALEFRRAYAAAVIDQARVAALSEQQAMLDSLSDTVAALAKGGEAAQYDLLRQRVHAGLHQRTLDAAAARAVGSRAYLEAWHGSKITLPSARVLELAGGSAGDARAFDGTPSEHPTLKILQADERASALESRAAQRRWVPELELFGGYRTTTVAEDTGHGFALSLSIPLTFFDHGQGEAALAEASRARADADEARARMRFDARLRTAAEQLDALSRNLAALESVVADATELLQKTQQLYAAGEATLTELLDAFRAAEEARLGVLEVSEEIVAVRLARMEAAGTQLDATLDQACSGQDRSKP